MAECIMYAVVSTKALEQRDHHDGWCLEWALQVGAPRPGLVPLQQGERECAVLHILSRLRLRPKHAAAMCKHW